MLPNLKAAIFTVFGSQADFARVLRVHESDVSRVVRGRRSLPLEEKKRWAMVLDRPVDDLFKVRP